MPPGCGAEARLLVGQAGSRKRPTLPGALTPLARLAWASTPDVDPSVSAQAEAGGDDSGHPHAAKHDLGASESPS